MSKWHRRDGSTTEYKSIVGYKLTHPNGKVMTGKPLGWTSFIMAQKGWGFESEWVRWGWKVERIYG